MMYTRMDAAPFMPIPITDEVLAQLVHPSIPRPMHFKLTKLFADRQFSDMWTQVEMRQMLSNACIMCGQAHMPGLLCRHLHEAHTCGHQFADFYNENLLPVFLKTMQSDFQCDFCQQIFNLPATHDEPSHDANRRQLVQIHLRGNCPVLLQTALLLGTALNGGRLGYEWLGRGVTAGNPGDVQVPEAGVRHEPTAATEPQRSQAASHRGPHPGQGQGRPERSRSTRSRAADGAPPVPPGTGPADAQTRAQSELAAKYRLFHTVLPAGKGGEPAGPDTRDPAVANAQAEEPTGGAATSAPASLHMAHEGHPHPGAQSFHLSAWRPPAQSLHGPTIAAGGHELAVPQMGSHSQETDGGQETAGFNEQDAPALGGTLRGPEGPDAGGQIPGLTNLQSPGCNAVETSTELASRQAVRTAGVTDALGSLAAGRDDPEATRSQTECVGSLTPPTAAQAQGQGTGEREVQEQADRLLTNEELHNLRCRASIMSLTNDSVWCFANVTVHCLIWAILCQSDVDTSSWGKHFESLSQMILTCDRFPIALIDQEWFKQVLETWGRPQAQQDCGEFVNTILCWLQSPVLDMHWERRCEQNDHVRCIDQGGCNLPLFLQFSPAEASHTDCKIDALVLHWCQAYGMRAALTRAPPLLCLHIDRLHTGPDGLIEKSSCALDLDSEINIPVFRDAKLESVNVSYILIAAASHLGQDAAGHYQALLRIHPVLATDSQPAKWLLTQDNARPCPIWRIPELFQRNLTVAWLVRSDCIQLPHYFPGFADAQKDEWIDSDPTAKLLELLQPAPKSPQVTPSDMT